MLPVQSRKKCGLKCWLSDFNVIEYYLITTVHLHGLAENGNRTPNSAGFLMGSGAFQLFVAEFAPIGPARGAFPLAEHTCRNVVP